MLASVNATMQASIAIKNGNNYGLAMALVGGTVAVVIAGLIFFSRERRGIDMTESAKHVGVAGSV